MRLTTSFIALIAIISFALFYYNKVTPSTELQIFGEAPKFSAEEASTGKFDSSKLAGKVWLFNLFFTSCPSTCPIMTRAIEELSKKYPEITFVSLSVDPERDSKEVLAKYKARHSVPPAQWHVLSAPMGVVKEVAEKGFRLGTGDAPDMHSASFALIDEASNIRGFFRATDSDFATRLDLALDSLK